MNLQHQTFTSPPNTQLGIEVMMDYELPRNSISILQGSFLTFLLIQFRAVAELKT